MNRAAPRVLVLSVAWLFLIAARQGQAQSDDNLMSPVATLEDFRKARDLGDQAESSTESAEHWRLAVTWQSNHVEWLRLARKFAEQLRDEAPDPGDPRHEEAIQQVADAARRVGTPVGIYALSAEEVNRRVAQGFQFVTLASDQRLLHAQVRQEMSRLSVPGWQPRV